MVITIATELIVRSLLFTPIVLLSLLGVRDWLCTRSFATRSHGLA